MNKRISVGVAAALVFLAMAVTATVSVIAAMHLFDSKVISVKSTAATYDKLYEMNTIVSENFYYDVDANATKDTVINGYIAGLNDPATEYLTAEQIAARNAEKTGLVISTGLVCAKDPVSGYLAVSNVLKGSSAEAADLINTDVIISIDGINVAPLDEEAALELLEGDEETKVSVTYTRDSVESTVELTRTKLTAASVISGSDGDYYYIRIKTFCDTTADQLAEAIAAADDLESKGIILDLRDTAGGNDISLAAEILDKFLPEGPTIYADYGNGELTEIGKSDSRSVEIPVVVLVNSRTSGYSEIVAAGLSKSQNTSIVGNTTAGRGTLQELYTMTDGSGINLTVAMLYISDQTSIDMIGVKPEYELDAGEGFTLTDAIPDNVNDVQFRRAEVVLESMLK